MLNRKQPQSKNIQQGSNSTLPSTEKSKWKSFLTTLGAITALLGGIGLIGGGAWVGIQVIINPDGVVWLNRFLPKWTRIPLERKDPPQTLAQIQDEVMKKGLIYGESILLTSSDSSPEIAGEESGNRLNVSLSKSTELLIPILSKIPNCQIDCEQIIELRVYQPTELDGEKGYYRLVSQVVLAPLEDSLAIDSNNYKVDNAKTAHSLPLTKLTRLDGGISPAGIWFNLIGQIKGNKPITYGQIIHYNPSQTYLSVMSAWSNPSGELPYWQEVKSRHTPNLIINKTVGLEPQFQVYQLKKRNFVPDPVELQEISLEEPDSVANLPEKSRETYNNALLLAKSGLWSSASKLLQSIKPSKPWAADVQAQLDLIAMHSQFTQAQIKNTINNPAQQVIVNLIDGNWENAIKIFQTAEAQKRYEIGLKLQKESGYLSKRIDAALKVDANQTDVQVWRAMIQSAKYGLPKAIAFIQQKNPKATKIAPRIYELLAQLDEAFFEASTAHNHFSQILGNAKILTQINQADWLQPKSNSNNNTVLKLETQQVWYRIQVSTFNDGQRWRRLPFSDIMLSTVAPGEHLWRLLGLNTDPQIQITISKSDGQKNTVMAIVKAVQIKNGVIELLAAGEILDASVAPLSSNQLSPQNVGLPPLFAHTDKAIQWLKTDTVTLADLYQIQPQWVALWLPTLWQELQKAGKQPIGNIPSLDIMLQSIGHLLVQPIDLTGNNQPEAVLTLAQDSNGLKPSILPSGFTNKQSTITLIFADSGALIYNGFSSDKNSHLMAIANLGNDTLPALIIDDARNYIFKKWSKQRQRFE